jgi:Putative polyhydroxyalkanoic acid system protein (PHA_gran_rgn)
MRMASPLIISIPHQLGRAEARHRIEGGFAKIINLLPGSSGAPSQHWDGDRLIFSVATLGQTVSGVIQVLDATVTIELELPGVVRVIASGLKERLQKVGQLLLTKK